MRTRDLNERIQFDGQIYQPAMPWIEHVLQVYWRIGSRWYEPKVPNLQDEGLVKNGSGGRCRRRKIVATEGLDLAPIPRGNTMTAFKGYIMATRESSLLLPQDLYPWKFHICF
jgi:hypothetical protein